MSFINPEICDDFLEIPCALVESINKGMSKYVNVGFGSLPQYSPPYPMYDVTGAACVSFLCPIGADTPSAHRWDRTCFCSSNFWLN